MKSAIAFLCLSTIAFGSWGCSHVDSTEEERSSSEVREAAWIEQPQDFRGLIGTYSASADAPEGALHSLSLTGTDDEHEVAGNYAARTCASCASETGTFRAGYSLMTVGSYIQLAPAGQAPSDDDFYLLFALRRGSDGKVTEMKLARYTAATQPFLVSRTASE